MGTSTVSSVSDDGVRWETVTRHTPAPMRPVVSRLYGYDERTPGPRRRDELPGATIPIIIELGPPLHVAGLERKAGCTMSGGFAAGLSLTTTRTAHDGWQRGIQLDLRPTAAARLLGLPLGALQGRTVPLVQLPEAAALARLATRDLDWTKHLDAVERWVARRLMATDPTDPRIAWAEEQLLEDDVPVHHLWRELRMSERHFIRQFTETVGISPKRYARLCRFDRVCRLLRRPRPLPLARVAVEAGCYDQAHLNRETRALAGLTPRELRDSLRA